MDGSIYCFVFFRLRGVRFIAYTPKRKRCVKVCTGFFFFFFLSCVEFEPGNHYRSVFNPGCKEEVIPSRIAEVAN